MRFHCLGIPHTVTSKEYLPCAFTQKVLKFCQMMTDLGHEVIHYGNEASDVVCTEHVSVTTLADLDKTYQHKPQGRDYWKHEAGFDHAMDSHVSKQFMRRANREIRKRAKRDDFVLAFWGLGHQPVCDALGDLPVHVVEPGVGYPATFAKYRVFESYAKLHFTKGQWDASGVEAYTVPNWTDAVIPNYFDPNDFEYSEDKDDYLLFIGRVVNTKGVEIAMRLADRFGLTLKVAGQGDFVANMGWEPYDCVEIVGAVGLEERKPLLSRAKAVVCASWYIEPFCGTHIEAGFSGTPVLVTDWGVFTETVVNGANGFRCRSFEEFVRAMERIESVCPEACRGMAMEYSMERVAPQYEQYFERLLKQIHQPTFWDMPRRTPEGTEYYPGGSIKGGDKWLREPHVWNYVMDEFKVESVLDIGAGEGHAAWYFSKKGCHVIAVDKDVSAIENAVFPVVCHDMTERPLHGGKVDLVYMAEFVEHLPEEALPNLAYTITPYKTDFVLMTFAPPGAGGVGHVNCQDEAYWVLWMKNCGFHKCEKGTIEIREIAEHPHFRERGLLFRRS